MRQDVLLDVDVADSARALIAQGRLLAEKEPALYHAARRHRTELAGFFTRELGWRVEVLEAADMVRLHKRRVDVPGDRGPRLRRDGRETVLAPRTVLILAALVCEQLWRRPRVTLNDLLQAVAQVCAADSTAGLLPRFVVVAGDGVSKREAHDNRQNLVDALRLLAAEGTITVDSDLDRAAADDNADLVVTATRDRLVTKFSSLSPSLLRLADLPPQQHVRALTTDLLSDVTGLPDDFDVESDLDTDGDAPESRDGDLASEPTGGTGRDDESDGVEPGPASVDDEPAPLRGRVARRQTDERRRRAMRRLVDDPGLDPAEDDYLQTSTGRTRALHVLHALGLTATARRDWWQVTDPSGLGSGLDFPNGRRTERQAALALLDHLGSRELAGDGRELPVVEAEIIALLEQVRLELPRWAASYGPRLAALAHAAALELTHAGLLRPLDDHVTAAVHGRAATGTHDAPPDEPRWQPTPAVRLWRVRVRTSSPPATAGDGPADAEQTAMFDP